MNSLTIATYNVLAQCFVEPERYTMMPQPWLHHPDTRRAALLDTIAALDVHVLLLQEVEPALLAALQERLGQRYRFFFSQRPTHTDGCVIGVCREAAVLDHHTLVFRDREPGYSQVAGVATVRLGAQTVTVASTHLRCGCQAMCGQPPLGLLQMRELLAHLQAKQTPIVLGGDLNALPDSPTLQAAFDAGLWCAEDAPTACIRGAKGKRDYLLHAGLALHAQPTPAFVQLPDACHPSDHVPLTAVVAPGSLRCAATPGAGVAQG